MIGSLDFMLTACFCYADYVIGKNDAILSESALGPNDLRHEQMTICSVGSQFDQRCALTITSLTTCKEEADVF